MKYVWHGPCYIHKKHKIQFFRTRNIKEERVIFLDCKPNLSFFFFFPRTLWTFSSYFSSLLASVLLLLPFALHAHSDISISVIFNITFYWKLFFPIYLVFDQLHTLFPFCVVAAIVSSILFTKKPNHFLNISPANDRLHILQFQRAFWLLIAKRYSCC